MINKIASFCTFIATITTFIQFSFADITERRTLNGSRDGVITKVYFEYNGKPYNKPVIFTIDCFGYKLSKRQEKTPRKNYKSKRIFSFEGTCPRYGYVFTNLFETRLHVDYCLVEGKLENGKTFSIKSSHIPDYERCVHVSAESDDSYEYFNGNNGLKCELRFDIAKKMQVTKRHGITHTSAQVYETRFLISLLYTIFIEVIILFLFIWFVYRMRNIKKTRIIFIGALASIITLPYLWFVLPVYIKEYLLPGELVIVVIEAALYTLLLDIKPLKAFIVSTVANLFSFVYGLMFIY